MLGLIQVVSAIRARTTAMLLLSLFVPVQTGIASCQDAWFRSVDRKVGVGDGHGHGPDIGSKEWQSAVEFKLGVRGAPRVPHRDSEGWCRFIDGLMRQGPSYDCDKVQQGSIEQAVCEDVLLSSLDRKLNGVYTAALISTDPPPPRGLRAEQRGWIKGRNDCWKADDERQCVRQQYIQRIAELQARFRLVPDRGPYHYVCNDNPANPFVATYFRTSPPTLIAEYGGNLALMFLQPAASGAKYQGGNQTLWEHQGEATVTWGFGAPTMRCAREQ